MEHLHQDGCHRGRGLARGGINWDREVNIVWEDRTGVVAHGTWSEHENKTEALFAQLEHATDIDPSLRLPCGWEVVRI